jgi:hypothetical protein
VISELISNISNNADFITAMSTSILALTSISSISTYLLIRKTEKSKFDPHVIILVEVDERTAIFYITVKNIGNGVAKDIKFEHSRPIPKKAFGFSPIKEPTKEIFKEDHPLFLGIKELGPGQIRKFTWGQYAGIKAALSEDTITTICRFKSNRNRKIRQTISNLDVDSFFETTLNREKNVTEQILNELKNISKKLH